MNTQSILVVDDEKNIRLTMMQALESLSYNIVTAVNGEEALQILKEKPIVLVFLDLKLPGMNGLEVLQQIKSNWPATRTIIITAHATVEHAVEAMKYGAVDFIQKPFSIKEIRDLATSVINRGELNEANANDYPSLIKLTRLKINERNFIDANETIKKAIAANPNDPEAYNLLGAILEIRGDWLTAQKFYRTSLDLDPTYKPAAANLERTTSLNRDGKIILGAGTDINATFDDKGQ
ncbi:MAG: response regulator [Candidatus Riflebacteria bacterium HGW-Riflebacteria-1]|jgi:DNA-binding response OmpR family regulator|nr:MAG: response regulator [Candidatus Riflebacteria bacterium HGW-Riflebacteria-1]